MDNVFSEEKAVQTAAYFLFKAHGRLPILKLMKLLYLSERLSYEKYGEPIIGDKLVSMEHGPVLSRTLNRLNGMSINPVWKQWISSRESYDIALQDPSLIRSPEEDLLELSQADLLVLDEIWDKFGHLDKYQIRDYTHLHCNEWKDPDGSSIPITHETLFKVLNFSDEKSQGLISRLNAVDDINAAFSAS